MVSGIVGWVGRLLGAAAIGIVGAALVLEVGLRLASLAVAGDPAARLTASRDRVVILCAGDSHAWGLGKGYPAALAERLAARSALYHVVNLGVSGSNTAQVRKRFPAWLDAFRPAVVVVWSGINNLANRTDTEVWGEVGVAPLPPWQRVLESSRLWRFLRLWREEARLERTFKESGVLLAPDLYRRPDDPLRTYRRELPGGTELQHHQLRPTKLTPDENVRVTALDVRWLAETARARGIPMVVVTYPIILGGFVSTNEGIVRGAREAGIPVVDSTEAAKRVIAREGETSRSHLFDRSGHPTQILYDEVGAMILEVFDQQGWLSKWAAGSLQIRGQRGHSPCPPSAQAGEEGEGKGKGRGARPRRGAPSTSRLIATTA